MATKFDIVQPKTRCKAAPKRKAGDAELQDAERLEKKHRREADRTAKSLNASNKQEWLGHLRALTLGKRQKPELAKFLDFRALEDKLFDLHGNGT